MGSGLRRLAVLVVAAVAVGLCLVPTGGAHAGDVQPNGFMSAGDDPGAPTFRTVVTPPPGYMVSGIDVSNHQGIIDWSQVAASGQHFMYAKATEGVHFVDSFFEDNYLNAKSNGLFAGAYHYARPDRSSGEAQADFLLDHTGYINDGRTLPPVLDIEWPWDGSGSPSPCYGLTAGQMVSWIFGFISRIRARTGLRTLIYTNSNWWNPCTGSNSWFGEQPLFTARFAASPGALGASWSRFAFWQYTAVGNVPGVPGRVDQDVFNGSLGDLARLAGSQIPVRMGDYNGDGRQEAAIWRIADGTWWVRYSGGGGVDALSWGLPGDTPLVGDLNADGRDDYAIWRPSDATWWIRYSDGSDPLTDVHWGLSTDIPLLGDIDGDHRDDLIVWQPSDGTWSIREMTGTELVVDWGLPGDVPLLGDYNHDGRDDFVIWRPSNGTWWIKYSDNSGQISGLQWGLAGDIPLTGNVGGDSRDDFVVWRPSDGNWWSMYSSGGGARVNWGLPGDRPLLGQVSGNGYADFTIWRPSTGAWWVAYSDGSGYVSGYQWGLPTDIGM